MYHHLRIRYPFIEEEGYKRSIKLKIFNLMSLYPFIKYRMLIVTSIIHHFIQLSSSLSYEILYRRLSILYKRVDPWGVERESSIIFPNI